MRKNLITPLASLLIPAVTFLLFLLLAFALYPSFTGHLPSTAQPFWLQSCVTHRFLLKRAFLLGLLGSGVNSALTMVWLLTGQCSPTVRRQAKGAAPVFLFIVAAFLLVILLPALAYFDKTFNGAHGFSSWGSLSGLTSNYLLPVGALIFVVGGTFLIALTAVFSIFEFFICFKRPTADPT